MESFPKYLHINDIEILYVIFFIQEITRFLNIMIDKKILKHIKMLISGCFLIDITKNDMINICLDLNKVFEYKYEFESEPIGTDLSILKVLLIQHLKNINV